MTEKPMTVEEAVSGLLKAIDFDLWKEDTEDDLSVIKEITRIINAQRAQAVAEAMAWQPIETAPKDGTIIWACERSYWQAPVYCHKNELGQDYWFPAYFNTSDYPLNPAHWMPLLPAPPEGGAKDGR